MNQKLYPGVGIEDDPDIEVIYPEEPRATAGLWAEVKSITRDIIFAAVMAVLIVVFVVQPVKVEGTSMLPRLHDSERIFVNKFAYLVGTPQRGDIVVFWFPDDPSKSFIKRVIGLPGDRVDMDSQGRITINGQVLDESYLSPQRNRRAREKWEDQRTRYPEWREKGPEHHYVEVKDHYYFVMGDNRDASNDSRAWGLVPEKYIYGKAMFRYWPLTRIGTLNQTIDEGPAEEKDE